MSPGTPILKWGIGLACALSLRFGWSQGADLNFVQRDGGVHHALMAPHRNPDVIPPGFEIRLDAVEENGELWLVSDVRLPYGGYIISARCDVDYLGKFQVNWSDSAKAQTDAWLEIPPAEMGYEPFESKNVLMLLRDTRVSARVAIAPGTESLSGEVFLVLEPQCVPYRLPFQLNLESTGWEIWQGRLVSALDK